LSRERFRSCVVAVALLVASAAPAVASVEAEVAFHRGIAAYAEGRLEDARKAFQTVVDEDPRDVDALQYLGLIAQAQGRPEDAIEYYERILAVDEDATDARFDLGSALLEAGRPQQARQAFEHVIVLEEDDARAHFFAGVAAYRSGQYADAVRYMERAVELDPSLRTEASYYTGLAEAYQGNLSLASTAMDVVGQSPQSPLADSAANMQSRLQPAPSRRWTLSLTTGAEFDSNPTLAGTGFQLANEYVEPDEDPDARFVFRLQGAVTALQGERYHVRAGYDGYLGVHTEVSDVDLQTHVGYLTSGIDLDPVYLGLRYDFAYTWLDLTDSFRLLSRLTPTIGLRQKRWGLTQLHYQFDYADFDSSGIPSGELGRATRRLIEGRDGFRHGVGVDQYLFIEDGGVLEYLRFGVAGDFYDADRSEFSYEAWEASTGFGLALPFDTDLTVLYRYVRRNYDDESSLDEPRFLRRDDHIQLISLDLGMPIGDHWRVSAGSSASFNSSDVGVFDYNRVVAGGYVTYRF